MVDDIFIDNDCACHLRTPMTDEYKDLYLWLFDLDSTTNAHLVISHKILNDYNRSFALIKSPENLIILIGKLTREGRLVKKSNKEISNFKKRYFTKLILDNLRSNLEDHDHIPVVMMSDRQFVLTMDNNFTYDLENFPNFRGLVKGNPTSLPYN